MKVKEIIEQLKRYDQNADLVVDVRLNGQTFGIATPVVSGCGQSYSGACLTVFLPERMYVVRRK